MWASLQSRGCGQSYFYSIEVFNNATIFALIISLVAIKDFCVIHFFVQNIAAVRFVDNDQVVVGNGGHGAPFVVKDTTNGKAVRSPSAMEV